MHEILFPEVERQSEDIYFLVFSADCIHLWRQTEDALGQRDGENLECMQIMNAAEL